MELTAAIEGLKAIKEPCEVEVVTDSEYVKNGITTWIHNWKKRNWMTAEKKPVVNQDLWEELDAAGGAAQDHLGLDQGPRIARGQQSRRRTGHAGGAGAAAVTAKVVYNRGHAK